MNTTKRRSLFSLASGAIAVGATSLVSSTAGAQAPASTGTSRTFVLVHGAWHGGWCWRAVADRLRAAGHTVFTPTQTGLGERSHLLARTITLDIFIEDITNVIKFEQLNDVVLVGHSFGGIPITGVADRIPGKIRHLIYLDSLILQDGQSAFSQLPPDVVAARIKAADETSGGLSLPTPSATALGIVREEDQRSIGPRLTPHPLATYNTPLRLQNPVGNGVPRTYITCTAPIYTPLAKTREWVASQGWPMLELPTGHDAMITLPNETAALFAQIAV